MQEGELIRRIKRKDNEAISTMVNQNQTDVLKTAIAFVPNIDDARDISQEVFLKAINKMSKFRGQSSLKTWLHRITINESLNYLRKQKRKREVAFDEVTINEEMRLNDESVEQEQEFLSGEQKKILEKALNGLSKRQRVAFSLNKVDGFSYREIAEIMNVSMPAVESLIHRAKVNLRKRLIDYYEKK